jgi:phasin family protein
VSGHGKREDLVGAKPTKITETAVAAEQAISKTVEETATAIEQAAVPAAIEQVAAKTMSEAAPAVESAQAKVKQGMEKAMKTAEEFVAFSQGNVEAFVKSSQIWVTGVQDLSKSFVAAAQASMEEGISTFKALTGVKSVKEAFDLQAAYARSTLEKSVAESGKLTDASFKLTEQALAPITARVTVVVEKFSKAA